MTSLFKVFVSSVQKELEDERLIIRNLVNTDPFLLAHCTPVLYEYEPASADKVLEGCPKSFDNCQMLAQCLSYFHRIEERGSGFRRMREQMLNHGLDKPIIGTDTGYFQVTFPGPGDNIERLRVPEQLLQVTPAVEALLNKRQRKMMQWLVEGKELTSRQCKAEFGVTRAVTVIDFGKLVEMGLVEKLGAGRSTRYRLKGLV